MTGVGLFDAIYTARALRRLKPDPVPGAGTDGFVACSSVPAERVRSSAR
jgi:hypothetical protein